MTVCRYFEKGCCRFGDRCRFEHVTTNYDSYNSRNVVNNQERYGRREADYSNYYRNDYQQGNQRHEPRNYYENQRDYSPARYQENYRHNTRSEGYDNQYQNRYDQQPRYSEHNYGRNQHNSSNYKGNENVYGQNRYRWLSDDYRKQNQQDVDHSGNYHVQDSYRTSTPKGKVSFSFKVPESEIKKDTTVMKINEQDQLYAEIVKEDAKSWELGGQWPFTCYFPYPDKHGFPGFYDVSPEELRYTAYNAEKNNSYETYVQAVRNALAQVNQQRSELQIATPQLLNTMRRIRNGEDLYSTSKIINPISTLTPADTAFESMETAAFSVPSSNAAASFSFKLPTETDSFAKASATNFSFKLPAGTEIKAVPSPLSDGDINIYTPMGNLTDEEKEQFCASTFVLGKIPTKPPPQVLCT